MGHQHDPKNDPKRDLKPVGDEVKAPTVQKAQNAHPFFEPNDLTLLSIVTPMLSSNAQRLISFFINFGGAAPTTNPMSGLAEIFQQLPAKQKNSLTELAPAVLGMLSQDPKGTGSGGINPALISTLLTTLMSNKKEE
jgi:hypothetical protein